MDRLKFNCVYGPRVFFNVTRFTYGDGVYHVYYNGDGGENKKAEIALEDVITFFIA